MKEISVIGLGYVGLPLAVEFGKKRKVLGFDINPSRIEELKKGHDSTNECTQDQIEAAKNLTFTENQIDIKNSEIYIITVPTPVDHFNKPDLTFLEAACRMVGQILSKGNIVIFESTVFPGATEEVCAPILEQNSNLEFNKDFFCGYSPERINPGDKVNTLKSVIKITSGSNIETADEVDALYKTIIDAGTYQARSIKVAEAAKVIENSQRDLNIAFVNELSLIFDRLNIDTMEVLEAAGTKWNFLKFKPGMVGGHCISVDPYYLTHKAEEVGYKPELILAGRKTNDRMARYAAKSIIERMAKNNIDISKSAIAVFGATFKDNCPDIRNSKIFDLVDELERNSIKVYLIDPWADEDEVFKNYGYKLSKLSSCKKVDSIIVAVAHNEFKRIKAEEYMKLCKSSEPVFGDLKSIFSKNDLELAGFNVFRL